MVNLIQFLYPCKIEVGTLNAFAVKIDDFIVGKNNGRAKIEHAAIRKSLDNELYSYSVCIAAAYAYYWFCNAYILQNILYL